MKKLSAAFSLVQFSLVLVTIGLLAGGLLFGRSMLHAAELRSVITSANAYIAATDSFRQKYRALAGDTLKATTYWPNTANGNGDGVVADAERFRFWQHLNRAGFIEQSFTGIEGPGGPDDFILGTNVPAARAPLTGFGFYFANIAVSPSTYAVNLGNAFTYGKIGAPNSGPPSGAALTPADALTIDSKADDGHPSTGKWIANLTGGGHFGAPNACSTDANGNTYNGVYKTAVMVPACAFFIKSGY